MLATLEGHTGQVTSVAFSPDGNTVLTGSIDRTARLWETASGKLLATLEGHTGQVTSVAFSPDGKTVLTGSIDRTARLWDIASGKLLATLEGHAGVVKSVSFSPTGRFVITYNTHGRVLIWSTSEMESDRLLGFYHATFEIGAAYWYDNTSVVLVDKGRPQLHTHLYELRLEGNW